MMIWWILNKSNSGMLTQKWQVSEQWNAENLNHSSWKNARIGHFKNMDYNDNLESVNVN